VTTYYDRPLLKAPVWEWMISGYYYVGGLTGASLVLGAAAQLGDADGRRALIRRCHWIGFTGCTVSGILLVWDLGRPERFFNMLRVFRPTSPMNMGAWILTATSAGAAGALITGGRPVACLAGVCGAALATYTGVLVGNSAIPVWQQARQVLPILFGFSAMASTGSVFNLLAANEQEHRISGLFGVTGQAAELAAAFAMERRVSTVPSVGRPVKHGRSGLMWQAGTVFTAVSLLVTLLPGKSRKKRVAAGILGTLGSALMRFSIAAIGTASARDPRATFDQQLISSALHPSRR